MEVICYACGRGEYPENTLEAIAHCQRIEKDWRIEMDLQMTKDGEIILFHDDNLNRTTDLKMEVRDVPLHYIQQLNAGYNFLKDHKYPYRESRITIPTLREVFREFPNAKFLLDVHTNNQKAVSKIIQLVEQASMQDNIVVASKYDIILNKFRQKRNDWIYGAATKEVKNMVFSSFLYLDGLFPLKSNVLMIPVTFNGMKLLNPRVLEHVKRRNKRIWVWLHEGKEVITVNSQNQFLKLERMGVDGIFTEYPEKLAKENSLLKFGAFQK